MLQIFHIFLVKIRYSQSKAEFGESAFLSFRSFSRKKVGSAQQRSSNHRSPFGSGIKLAYRKVR